MLHGAPVDVFSLLVVVKFRVIHIERNAVLADVSLRKDVENRTV